jgi:DnaJ-class molecular chaperone
MKFGMMVDYSRDEYVHLKIETPTNLTRKQKELLEGFRVEEQSQDTPFKKFKRFFKN